MEARALEILHSVELTILRVDLAELFRDRVAKGCQAATSLPEAAKRPAERVAAFREVGAVAAEVGRNPLEARLAAAFGEVLAQQRQRNIEFGRQLGVQLEARALEILHLQAFLIEHLGQRQAEDIQPAVRIIEAFNRQADIMAGLGEEGETSRRRRLAGGRGGEWRNRPEQSNSQSAGGKKQNASVHE